ncbi:MAG: hypothetical protein OWS74_01385, partial [Firmicutes bacterium]|nr:hypothetical protein [Bacillota bacterium]
VPYALSQQRPDLLKQLQGQYDVWRVIPKDKPLWMMPYDGAYEKPVLQHFLTLWQKAASRHHGADFSVLSSLADLHPSWMSWSPWRAGWHSFAEKIAPFLTAHNIVDWLNVLHYNPYWPDEILWQSAPSLRSRTAADALLSLLWTPRPNETDASKIIRLQKLLALWPRIAPDEEVAQAVWLWHHFPCADPLHVFEATALHHLHRTTEAIALLEAHWPTHPADRKAVLAVLLPWVDPEKRVQYQLAYSLETGDNTILPELRAQLDVKQWQSFWQAFTRRWPTSPDGAPNQEPE